MDALDELVRYDGRHAVVTGCASGIGAAVARHLARLGARVTGLDRRAQESGSATTDFVPVDLADPGSVDAAAAAVGGEVDALFNVAGVSSGIGDPLLVMRINFLGMRQFTEALTARMPDGSAITNVSSLAASGYRDHARTTAGLLDTPSVQDGLQWCADHPDALADGGYRQSKEAIILYGMRKAVELGPRGIRVNCSAPGVTETPILDQLRSRYGQQYLDSFTAPLGRVSTAEEQAAVLVFLGSRAAGYITGQVVWADGGISAERFVSAVGEPEVTQRS
ncbi:3-alpha-hydroxysteroid dehydrogenase [Mycolicibacterium duvalii]|uniref:3-alpha-hydroxysteroid dehydrogenase n=1 Tax=Mycolicibacterium duvalii TaxID=39688 RepID=A0A7I7JW93_9MYCO|nr:coniferyl-alcohol dehydrogenase [Mycolicibacterium duvalii]MCV7370992.1 coniferyl-alcohol dehydrogenase [Mycolicibacterium duvalii]PEG37558.1 3-alpha-hydroxysteroid dehydrogenase [Mycolicibacterium duvalii]BBX15569.1 3-alpha-hydroxysteroid dehydrogenase [Mycolicibacterium duvalii]